MWYLCFVLNLVQISVIVTEINTHASDLHLMTSREFTSGFDLWSRDYLCMASVHLSILVQISLSNPELLIFYQN